MMPNRGIFFIIFSIIPAFLFGQMIANITEDVQTDFGTYHPYSVIYSPNVSEFSLQPDFSNVVNFSDFHSWFSQYDSLLLVTNHFAVKRSKYKQLYDIYNVCTWDGTPIFITTDAVLHIYHVLFDRMLADIEIRKLFEALDILTQSLIDETESVYNQLVKTETKEAASRNLAFLYVAKNLLRGDGISVPENVTALADSELVLISNHDGFHFSPIFGNFSALDYSQFQPRGHYTKNDTLEAYFKTMMWYGWTIFTMEPQTFGDLALRHTLQALMLTQMIYRLEADAQSLLDLWEKIYEPTIFFVGKTDDPNLRNYQTIAEQVYGSDFLSLSPDSLANSDLLNQFAAEAQQLPEPKIPNWIYGSFMTYKGFRFMGQRFIPDSYMFAHLVLPEVANRLFPRGLDVMAILGSDRAYTLLDSLYEETSYQNYAEKIADFKAEFTELSPSEWAQNLYWNWLYCLMPLLYEKGEGYPFFMQTTAWADRELLTALASWAELRHDTILYAKQSGTPMNLPPGPPRSYVEPNPHLYARLASLVRYTREGLDSFQLLLPGYEEKLNLFENLLLFLRNISIKELENIPLSDAEYEDIYCFGKVMENLVTVNEEADDMAVIADVHTDSNTDQCLEEGVGYPLEIFVIINEGGIPRITRGAIFSYYEFIQPITYRLTDEAWRDLLTGDSPPILPEWTNSFMDISELQPTFSHFSPESRYNKEFTPVKSPKTNTVPKKIKLHQNYPNPFNPETTIRFDLPKQAHVKITIYNVLGQRIRKLFSGAKPTGMHAIQWDGRDDSGRAVSSGLYIYEIHVNDFIQAKHMFLLR